MAEATGYVYEGRLRGLDEPAKAGFAAKSRRLQPPGFNTLGRLAIRTFFREQGLLKVRGCQRTDSTHVLAAIHGRNRLACIGETLRHALHVLATVAADWVQSWVPPVWFDRYRRAVNAYRLPKGKDARYKLAAPIGMDGREVRTPRDDPPAAAWLGEIPAVHGLRQVWTQQFYDVAPDALAQRESFASGPGADPFAVCPRGAGQTMVGGVARAPTASPPHGNAP